MLAVWTTSDWIALGTGVFVAIGVVAGIIIPIVLHGSRKDNAAAQVKDDKIPTDAKVGNRYIGKEEVHLSFLSTSDIARLFAYFLLRSHRLQRELSIDQFTPIADRLLKMPTSEVKTYVLGILQGMACGLEGYLEITEQKKVHLKKLPEHFEGHVKISNLWMAERNSSLAESLRKIDNIV